MSKAHEEKERTDTITMENHEACCEERGRQAEEAASATLGALLDEAAWHVRKMLELAIAVVPVDEAQRRERDRAIMDRTNLLTRIAAARKAP